MRQNNRPVEQIRSLKVTPHFLPYSEGSCLIEYGKTKIICSVSVEERLPKWLQGQDQGWLTAEYSMLPRSTHTRIRRDKANNSGRSQEISRLIARSLRAAVDLKQLKDISIILDCDVLQADGGTRTASITGGWIALNLACDFLLKQGKIKQNPIIKQVAALSVGLMPEGIYSDLNYEEDSTCWADLNLVMTHEKEVIEIQGTAEKQSFSLGTLNSMIEQSWVGFEELFELQKKYTHELTHELGIK